MNAKAVAAAVVDEINEVVHEVTGRIELIVGRAVGDWKLVERGITQQTIGRLRSHIARRRMKQG